MSLLRTIAEPQPYRARRHPATNEVIEKHIETITRLHLEGKALQADVDKFYVLFDCGDCPPEPPLYVMIHDQTGDKRRTVLRRVFKCS